MSDRRHGETPSPDLVAAQRALAEAQASAAADAPVLSQAHRVASSLREERMTNGWAERVRLALRGAA